MRVKSSWAWVFLAAVFLAVEVAAEERDAAADEMRVVVEGRWKRLCATSALLTDYGVGYAAAIEIIRDQPGGVMRYRPIHDPALVYRPLTKEKFRLLTEALCKSAVVVANEITPDEAMGEIMREKDKGASQEKLQQMLKKLPSGWDVETLSVVSDASEGPKRFVNSGRAVTLEGFLEKEFSVKWREFSREELKLALGTEPYE